MRTAKLAAIAGVPLLGAAVLAGCGNLGNFKVSSGGQTATCGVSSTQAHCSANGRSVTVAPGGGGGAATATSEPAREKSTAPVPGTPVPTASPVTASSAPPAATQDSVAAVQGCMGQFPGHQRRDTLVSFTTSSSARQDMATCLQIPPQTMALFLKLLFRYAYDAYIRGDFNSPQGQQQFTTSTEGDTLPHAVDRCRQEA